MGVKHFLVDYGAQKRSYSSYFHFHSFFIRELGVKKSHSKELRPFSRSEDDQQAKDYSEVVELLHHIGVRVEGVLLRLESWEYAIDD